MKRAAVYTSTMNDCAAIWVAIKAVVAWIVSIFTVTAPIFTAMGVCFAAYQFWQTAKQNKTRFEDDLMREYRDLINKIPVKALLGKELTDDEFSAAYSAHYHYLDLTNEEVFLRQKNRITRETWEYWCDGIKSNLSRPSFKKAWDQIRATVPEFTELRRLEQSEFTEDPYGR
jgi:hypothetical protein